MGQGWWRALLIICQGLAVSSTGNVSSAEDTPSTTTSTTVTLTATLTATSTTTATTLSITTLTATTVTGTTATSTLTSVTATTSTTSTALDIDGVLGEVFCSQQVIDAVFHEDYTETWRMSLLNENLDCTAYWRGILWLALERHRPKVALHMAQNYSYRSWQFYVQNETTKLTPLLMAADLGYTDVVEEILVKMSRAHLPMMKDNNGNTALHLASRWPATTAKLLQTAPNQAEYLAAVNLAGDQALHLALENGNNAAAEAIIEGSEQYVGKLFTGNLVRTPDGTGNYPVHLTGDAALLQLLVNSGAMLDTRNSAGALPLHTVAAFDGSAGSGALAFAASVVNTSEVAGGIDVLDAAGRTALHYAAEGGLPDNVRWLIHHGASTGARNSDGLLPLSLGLSNGHSHVVDAFRLGSSPPLIAVVDVGSVEMLRFVVLNNSIPADVLDPDTGRGAVFHAAETGQDAMVEFFLSQGVNVDSIDKQGISLLSAAVFARQAESVRALLNGGASVGQRLQNDSTPLHMAAALGALEEAMLLVQAGASVDAMDYLGQTPMHVCATAGVALVLLNHGASPLRTEQGLEPLHTAALAGHTEVATEILQWRHGGVDARTDYGNTPLHLAALRSNIGVVGLLLQWCADVQARNNADFLPSDFATDMDVAILIRDATFGPGRCQCDCGPYAAGAGPLFLSVSWRGGCAATVKCELDGFSGATEQLQCAPQPIQPNSTNVTSAWTPPMPTLHCRGSTSFALTGAHPAWILGFLWVSVLCYLEQ